MESTDNVVRRMSSVMVPGRPLLVVGPYGSGKFWLAGEACKRIGLATEQLDAAALDLPSLHAAFSRRHARPTALLVSDVDRLAPELVPDLRHFLALTSRTVVLLTSDPSKVHQDVLAQANVRFEVRKED